MSASLATEVLKLCMDNSRQFSDILIQEKEHIACKFPNGWESVGDSLVSKESIGEFLAKFDENWAATMKSSDAGINACVTLQDFRLRSNAYRFGADQYGIAIRKHALRPPLLQDIGLPSKAIYMLRSKGVLLTCGATGSGKTTTQASFIETINATRSAHIVTIEDPIEFLFKRDKCIFSQREVPHHVKTFNLGLMDAVRQKPDVIFIGELRDREAVDAAFRAGEAGALVLSSLHANSAEGAITKLLSFYEPSERKQQAELISSVLIGVVSQALIPAYDGKSWKLAYEILDNASSEMQKAIQSMESERIKTVMANDKSYGGLMNNTIKALIESGQVTKKDAWMASYDPAGLDAMTRSLGDGVR